MADKGKLPAPIVLALVVADEITRDQESGKCTIHGVFYAAECASFPTKASLSVYGAITGFHGKVKVEIRFVEVGDNDRLMAAATQEFSSKDPHTVVEMVLNFRDIIFKQPGEYRVQLLAGGEHLLERRIQLAVMDEDSDGG